MRSAASRTQSRLAARLCTLLAASCLGTTPAWAQEATVDQRLDRLEALVQGLVDRMDRQQGVATTADRRAVADTAEAIAETRAAVQPVRPASPPLEPKAQEDRGFRVGKTLVSYGGYVKLDVITQRFSGGEPPSASVARDFLIPGAIPVGGAPSGFDTDFSARQTRFLFKTATDVGGGHTLGSQIELDFMVTEGGDERVSNSYVPRLRQAFITYDKWLFGQTWSTFQNVAALPDSLDFIGVTPGTVFVRQPMIRYTSGGLQLAVEQPETTVTTSTGGRLLPGDDVMPDLVARYTFSPSWGTMSIAGIARALRIRDTALGEDTAFGYGLSVSGKLKLGALDDLRAMVTAGEGLGRYIGLNIVNDAALDATGRLNPIATYSGFAAYRHFWTPTLRSTLAGSYFKADNPVRLTTGLVTDESWNALGNLIWSPVAPLDVGIEYLYAERTLEDGRNGSQQKVQVSTRYNF